VWNKARRFDVLGTTILHNEYLKNLQQRETTGIVQLNQEQHDLALAHFESAFECYNEETNNHPSEQIFFEFAGFCWAMVGDGPCPWRLDHIYHRCGEKYSELMEVGFRKYPCSNKLLFLKRYELHRLCFDITKEDILETIDPSNPVDIPYFLLFLLEDKKKYLDNVKILWEECTKEITLFNRLIISLIEYDCDPKLSSKRKW
jgi:hypothetical protein